LKFPAKEFINLLTSKHLTSVLQQHWVSQFCTVPKNRRIENNYVYGLAFEGDKSESIIVRRACAFEQSGWRSVICVQESTLEGE
jgi:hypothetical protein